VDSSQVEAIRREITINRAVQRSVRVLPMLQRMQQSSNAIEPRANGAFIDPVGDGDTADFVWIETMIAGDLAGVKPCA
jgi:hypothetical protein